MGEALTHEPARPPPANDAGAEGRSRPTWLLNMRRGSNDSPKLSSLIRESLEPMMARDSINYGKSRLFFFLPGCERQEASRRHSKASNTQFAYISNGEADKFAERLSTKQSRVSALRLPRNSRQNGLEKENRPYKLRPSTNQDCRPSQAKRESKSTSKSALPCSGLALPRTSKLGPKAEAEKRSWCNNNRVQDCNLGRSRRSENIFVSSAFKRTHQQSSSGEVVPKRLTEESDCSARNTREQEQAPKVQTPKKASPRNLSLPGSRQSRSRAGQEAESKLRTLPEDVGSPLSTPAVAKYISLDELNRSQIRLPIVEEELPAGPRAEPARAEAQAVAVEIV